MNSTEIERIESAQKKHTCNWCLESINAGDTYYRYRSFHDNAASTVKMHPECKDAAHEMILIEGGSFEFDDGEQRRGCTCYHCPDCEKCKKRGVLEDEGD